MLEKEIQLLLSLLLVRMGGSVAREREVKASGKGKAIELAALEDSRAAAKLWLRFPKRNL